MRAEFEQPTELLAAYFRSRGEAAPADDARWLLKVFVQSGFRWRDAETRSFALHVLGRGNFDVSDLAENFLGIDLYVSDLSCLDAEAGAPVFGLAKPDARIIEICQRAESYEPLFRSTVMHEVAHVMKHRCTAARTLCYSPAARRRPPEEREADQFMAEALLPRPMLFLAVICLAEQVGLNPGEALCCANSARGWFQWKHHYFRFLIDTLCVSRELIGLQLLHLGYITPATLDYHRSYPLTTRWRDAKPGFNFRYVVEAAAADLRSSAR
jgi:hypothetical protein